MVRFVGSSIALAVAIVAMLAGSAAAAIGSWTLTPAPGSPYPVEGTVGSLAIGDFNRDGLEEFAAATTSSSPHDPGGTGLVSPFLATGDGGFSLVDGTSMHAPVVLGSGLNSIVSADFNGDGKPDLAEGNDGQLWVQLGNGDGTFTQVPGARASLGEVPIEVVSADFNGDGKPDIAGVNYGPTVSVLLGNGDGTFSPAPGFPLAFGSKDYGSIATADFTGDGKPDLAVTDAGNNTLTVVTGVGTPSVVVHSPIVLDGPPRSVYVDDFNGDGKPDVALDNTQAGKLTVLLGQGQGNFSPAPGSPVALGASIDVDGIATLDFNGDHIQDLAAVGDSAMDGSVFLLAGDGDGGFRPAGNPVEVGPSPQMLGAGTFAGRPGLVVTPRTCCGSGLPGELAVLFPTPAPPEAKPPSISHPPPPGHVHVPTTAQIRSTLLRSLNATKRTIGIRWLLEHHRYAYRVRALIAGRVTIEWTATKTEARHAHVHSRMIASGSVSLVRPGKKRVAIRLTRAGRRILTKLARVNTTATISLRARGRAAITARRAIVLSRR
jgi:hypothetical protein